MKTGDRVKICKGADQDNTYYRRHLSNDGREGIVERVDDSDNTIFVGFSADTGWWFYTPWVSELESSWVLDDDKYCSCGGPEKIVIILFQSVRVCEKCKKEKR
jgi:hypothetical protein